MQGRGLGRVFLRHLRRTRAILHVVDGAAGECPPALHKFQKLLSQHDSSALTSTTRSHGAVMLPLSS